MIWTKLINPKAANLVVQQCNQKLRQNDQSLGFKIFMISRNKYGGYYDILPTLQRWPIPLKGAIQATTNVN